MVSSDNYRHTAVSKRPFALWSCSRSNNDPLAYFHGIAVQWQLHGGRWRHRRRRRGRRGRGEREKRGGRAQRVVNGGIDEVDESLFPVRRRNICHIAVLRPMCRESVVLPSTPKASRAQQACATRRKELNRRLNMRDPVSSSYD